MKKVMFSFLATVIFLIPFLFPTSLFAQTLQVITKENSLREYPRFFAPIKAFLKYGDILELLHRENDWYYVRFRGFVGYVHSSAVERRAFSSPSPFRSTSTVTEGEIALAGKGFNPQVEQSFREKNPQLRYDLVERIEKFAVSDNDLFRFLYEGGLREPR